jgi:hypothetical protein
VLDPTAQVPAPVFFGLEAVSLGAAHALLVDADARAAAVARDNTPPRLGWPTCE